MDRSKSFGFGPAVLVTAAFIGPGTVMAASSAGAEYGYVLLWAVAFSVFATIVLQEMAARLGIVSGSGISQAIKTTITNRWLRFLALALILLAIFVGNSAYQTGNILGAAVGVMSMGSQEAGNADAVAKESGPPDTSYGDPLNQNVIVFVIGLTALALIWIGRFDVLQQVLTILVGLMSVLFIVAAVASGPDWGRVVEGFIPRVPAGSDWIVIGLIGTTVVPYNLFLHASAAAERWNEAPSTAHSGTDAPARSDNLTAQAIRRSRLNTIGSILLGGLITSSILVTACAAFHGDTTTNLGSVKDVAEQLEPALGSWSKILFALGLLAAGLTSAITAPVAAGYAAAGCFGWPGKLSDWRLKITASLVVICGVYCAVKFGSSPKETIVLAQVANGLLLPIIAIGLLVMVNNGALMKEFRNRRVNNFLAVLVILIVGLIAVNQFRKITNNFSTSGKKAAKRDFSAGCYVSIKLEGRNLATSIDDGLVNGLLACVKEVKNVSD